MNLNLENWLYEKAARRHTVFFGVLGIDRRTVVPREDSEKCPVVVSVGLQGHGCGLDECEVAFYSAKPR